MGTQGVLPFSYECEPPRPQGRHLLSGKMKMPGSVFKLSKTPGYVKFPAPFLGQHNYEVYSTILGYIEQEVRKLQEDGII